MRRKTREPRAAWAIQFTFVPCRDGPGRLEQAFLALLDARAGADGILSSTDEGTRTFSSDARPGRRPTAGGRRCPV
jgi:hypothetical protein